jgi:hypothetical protein
VKYLLTTLTLIVLTSLASGADSSAKQAPIWDVTFSAKGSDVNGSSVAGKLYVIQTSDTEFRVLDPASHSQTTGKKDSEKLNFRILTKEGTGVSIVPAALFGFTAKSTLSGQGSLGNQSVVWNAKRLVSLWVCSNHSPKHTASGERDMQQLTKDHKCEGWHRLANPQTDPVWVNIHPGQ